MSNTLIEKENLNGEIKNSDKPVLIEFFADWCATCKMISPLVDEVAEEITDKKIVKVDVDQYPELAEEFNIKSIPTFILYKDGKEQSRSYGAKSKKAILQMLKG